MTPRPARRGDDDRDRLWRRVLWTMPSGLYVIGTAADGRRNLMTANLVVQVATDPRQVAVAIESDSLTRRLLDDGAVFAVSLLRREDRAMLRRFAKAVPESDVDVAASGAGTMGAAAVIAAVTGAPVLAQAAAYVDCRVAHAVALGSHVLYVGEVVDAGFGPGGEDVEVLRMEDTRLHYGG